MTLTDQSKALPLLDHNIQRNAELLKTLNGSVRTKSLDWCNEIDEPSCDVLLLADCVYYQEVGIPADLSVNITVIGRYLGNLLTETTLILLSL